MLDGLKPGVKHDLKYLDTHVFTEVANDLDASIELYNDDLKLVSEYANLVIQSWHGDAKNEFQKDYIEIYQHLKDVNDEMYQLYDNLIDIAATFEKADEELAKLNTMVP